MKKKIFKLGELFCGPGGMAIAASKSIPQISNTGICYSIEHSWGVDRSKDAIETFKANLGEKNGIMMDAKDFVSNCLDEKHKINALAFGFPCNSFSLVGESKGMEHPEYGLLYQTGVDVINKYNPIWFIAENVSGISSHDSGSQFQKILQDLANSGKGYNVVAHLYKFEEYGVPQCRHRYVIVGISSDYAKKKNIKFNIPAPTHGIGRIPYVTVAEALSSVNNQTNWGNYRKKQSDKVVWRLKFTKPGGNAWLLDELVDKNIYSDERLLSYLKELPWYKEDIAPLGDVDEIRKKIEYARLHCKSARMSHIYKRLEKDKPAYTLTGSGGGGTHVYHWEDHRALTNEERAALQTFPKDFVFKGGDESVRRQIGMAVPTAGAKVIFEAILKTFAGIHYPSIAPDPKMVKYPQKEQK